MPLYEYICESCGEITSRLVSNPDPIEATPLKCDHCDMCASLRLHLAGTGPLHFKGPGFHTTDYPRQKSLGRKKVVAVNGSRDE